MLSEFWLWTGFNLFVLVLLVLDMLVLHRRSHEIKMREATILSIGWVLLALAFNAFLYYSPHTIYHGNEKRAMEFFTGYLIELFLSADNLFVFLLIFMYFKVPAQYQHRVLFWGIIGAQILRAGFILGGAAIIGLFSWMIYVFGLFLIYTGIKMAFHKDDEADLGNNKVIQWTKRIIPVSHMYDGKKFFTHMEGKWLATPLFVVLIVVDVTDVIFAVDSIPAIFGITKETFIVYSSNIFAILGLRAMYFVLAGLTRIFHYLNYGLSFILSFIGLKMIWDHTVQHYFEEKYKHLEVPTWMALGVVVLILLFSILASLIWPPKEKEVAADASAAK